MIWTKKNSLRGAIFILLVIFAHYLYPLIMGAYYLYDHVRRARSDAEFLGSIKTFDQIDHIDPNRKPRTVIRSKEMEQAYAMVEEVFQTAQEKSDELQHWEEIRFYLSPVRISIPGYPEPVNTYESLQAFRVNTDQTVSYLGVPRSMPTNIVFYPNRFSELMYFDNESKLMWLPLTRRTSGHIIFYDLKASNQVPEQDRMLTFLDNKIYTDGSDDIRAKVSSYAVAPDIESKPSAPVH